MHVRKDSPCAPAIPAPELALDELRLLAETGFPGEAKRRVSALLAAAPADLECLGLKARLDHATGAISEAIDGWKLLHDASPHSHAAIYRIAALREEAQGGSPATDLPLVRRAVALALEGRHDRALAACAQGRALAASPGDREQRKLLGLLEALLHELGGRLGDAIASLEELGVDPAFSLDIDRLSILARICERKGDRGSILVADRVLSFLAESGKLSAFPRLIELRRILGDEAGGQEVERAFERAFSSRMHWLTPPARLAAAARRYVPVARLAALALPPPETVEAGVERGISLLVRGDPRAALRSLPDDRPAWRAAALLETDSRREALAAAVEAILASREPDVPLAFLIASILSTVDCLPAPPQAIDRAREALHLHIATSPASPRSLRCLAVLEDRAGAHGEATTLRARAAAACERPWPPPGVVRAAAIYSLRGKSKGLVHDVIARRVPAEGLQRGRLLDSEIHGCLGEGVRDQLRRTFASVREALVARFPDRAVEMDGWSYGLHLTKEDEPSGGPSLGLPVAVAFASVLLDVRVPSRYVFTGALSYDAAGKLTVRKVGELGHKLKATLHAGARTMVLPASQADEALSGHQVPKAIAAASIHPVGTLDDVLALLLTDSPTIP